MQEPSFQSKFFPFIGAIAIAILLVVQGSLNTNESVDVSFSEFKSLLKSNGIQHVSYKDKEIKALLKRSKQLRPNYEFATYVITSTHEIDDQMVWALLDEAQVKVNQNVKEEKRYKPGDSLFSR